MTFLLYNIERTKLIAVFIRWDPEPVFIRDSDPVIFLWGLIPDLVSIDPDPKHGLRWTLIH